MLGPWSPLSASLFRVLYCSSASMDCGNLNASEGKHARCDWLMLRVRARCIRCPLTYRRAQKQERKLREPIQCKLLRHFPKPFFFRHISFSCQLGPTFPFFPPFQYRGGNIAQLRLKPEQHYRGRWEGGQVRGLSLPIYNSCCYAKYLK